ncbi:MAG: hypothetical protein SVY53_12795 [Chloroflexota bacterium]|nr:hypothetical protein [Chloroflexota bacterium]
MKRILLVALVLVLLTLLNTAVVMAQDNEGSISGQVLNGTQDNTQLGADLEVVLITMENGSPLTSSSTLTDDSGGFEFVELSTDAAYAYFLTTVHQNVEYMSNLVQFDEEEVAKTMDVTVYDAASDENYSTSHIRIGMAHSLIHVQEGSIFVEEFISIINDGNQTYVGSEEIPGSNGQLFATLKFYLPSDADKTTLQYAQGIMSGRAFKNSDGFVDTLPVTPGAKEIAYSYEIPFTTGSYTFNVRTNYHTSGVALLIQDNIGVSDFSDQLVHGETTEISGEAERFTSYSASNIGPNNVLEIELSRAPDDYQDVYKWIGIVFAIMAVIVPIAYVIARRGQSKTIDVVDER